MLSQQSEKRVGALLEIGQPEGEAEVPVGVQEASCRVGHTSSGRRRSHTRAERRNLLGACVPGQGTQYKEALF